MNVYTNCYLTKPEDLMLNVFDGYDRLEELNWLHTALRIMELPVAEWDDPQPVSGEFEAK